MFSVVRGVGNGPMSADQRTNCVNGLIVSTDFQFVPTGETYTTGIATIAKKTTASSPSVYTLDGRKVETDISNLPKGIYIIGNKKIIIR